MIPYGHQSINKNDIDEVVKALKSDWLTQGPRVFEFEKALAKYCGVRYAVAVSHGTAALHLAYLTAGLKEGDEAITTPNTFVATTNMLIAVGAKPVFCDIRPDTYNIDEAKIERLITKKTRAIVPVHFAGHPCEMEKIKKIAKKHNLLVIEDACHALGAKYKNSKVGSCKYSDLAVFSFHPIKSITTGEGGAITTNNKKYYQKLLLMRNHGIKKDKKGFNVMKEFGYNYRMTDMQSALGISQLRKIDKFIEQRHRIAGWYGKELNELDQIILPQETKNSYSGWHLCVIRTINAKNRLPLFKHLLKNNIGVNFHYPRVYSHPYYRQKGFGNAKCVMAENYEQTAITLPLYPSLTRENVIYIANTIKSFFKT